MVYSQVVSQSSSKSSKEFPLQEQKLKKRQTMSKCPWSLGERISWGPKCKICWYRKMLEMYLRIVGKVTWDTWIPSEHLLGILPRSFQSLEGLIYTLCLYYYIIYAYNWCQLLGNKTVSSVMLQYPRAQILYSQLRLCLFMKKSMGRIHAISFMLPHVQSEASNSEPIRMASCFSHNFRTKNAGKRLMPHCGGDNMDLNFLCELTIMSTAVL